MNSSSNGLTTFEFLDLAQVILGNHDLRLPLMLWSLTGVGKSAVVRQAVERVSDSGSAWKPEQGVQVTGALEVINDWGLVDLRTSLMEPTDLRGLPDLKGNIVRWVVPDELPVIGQEKRFPKRGILFLDELTHRPASHAVGMLSLGSRPALRTSRPAARLACRCRLELCE